MTKSKFLETLRFRLMHLPATEIEKHLSFYIESIEDRVEDGMMEEEAVKSLGNIDDIVLSIEQSVSLPTIFKQKIKQTSETFNNKALWILLIILGAPLWMPLLFASISMIFSVYIVAWSIIVIIYSVVFALGVSGVAIFIGGIINSFTATVPLSFMIIGIALALIGLSVLCLRPAQFISKKLVYITRLVIRNIKKLFIRKKVVA